MRMSEPQRDVVGRLLRLALRAPSASQLMRWFIMNGVIHRSPPSYSSGHICSMVLFMFRSRFRDICLSVELPRGLQMQMWMTRAIHSEAPLWWWLSLLKPRPAVELPVLRGLLCCALRNPGCMYVPCFSLSMSMSMECILLVSTRFSALLPETWTAVTCLPTLAIILAKSTPSVDLEEVVVGDSTRVGRRRTGASCLWLAHVTLPVLSILHVWCSSARPDD